MKQQTPQEWKQYFETEQFDEAYYYEGADLGYTLQEDGISFKVWAPTAENVVLNLNCHTNQKILKNIIHYLQQV